MSAGAVAAFAVPPAAASVTATGAAPDEMFLVQGADVKTSITSASITCDTANLFGTWGDDVTNVSTLNAAGPLGGTAHNTGITACKTSNPNVLADISNLLVSDFSLGETEGSATVTYAVTLTIVDKVVIGQCHFEGEVKFSYPHNDTLELTLVGSSNVIQTLETTCPIGQKGETATLSGSFTVTTGTDGSGGAIEISTP